MKNLDRIQKRILNLDELKKALGIWRFQQKKIIFTNGCFDLVHLGTRADEPEPTIEEIVAAEIEEEAAIDEILATMEAAESDVIEVDIVEVDVEEIEIVTVDEVEIVAVDDVDAEEVEIVAVDDVDVEEVDIVAVDEVEIAPIEEVEVAPVKAKSRRKPTVEESPPASLIDPDWVRGDGTGECPDSHPVKAKASSMIYYTPESGHYERTIPDVCFAGEADAEAAGYRPPRR